VTVDRRALRRSLSTNFTPSFKDRLGRVRLRARQLSHVPALVTGASLDRPIFIVGAPRSGTALLFNVVRASSRLAHWPGEAHEVWEADYHPALRGWESNVLDANDVTPEAAARIRRSFLLLAGSRKRLIGKTPRNSLRIPFVDALFGDARYVFLRRDGRDNVNSLINAWRSPRYRTYELPEPHRIPGADPRWWKFVLYPGWRDDLGGPLEVVCAKQWKSSNDFALSGAESIPLERWLEVSYEDFTQRPVEETGRLMDLLELPYEQDVRERAAAALSTPINVVTPPERGKWRRENPKEIDRIMPLIAETMGALGYK
jgi:Sulfotransferase family